VPVVIRLRSGDAVFMGGPSRFAWHGVPRIVAASCPAYLAEWPATPTLPRLGTPAGGAVDDVETKHDEDGTSSGPPDEYEHWRGWMGGKRVNLNVRQMWD
jgi:hypothetical protein